MYYKNINFTRISSNFSSAYLSKSIFFTATYLSLFEPSITRAFQTLKKIEKIQTAGKLRFQRNLPQDRKLIYSLFPKNLRGNQERGVKPLAVVGHWCSISYLGKICFFISILRRFAGLRDNKLEILKFIFQIKQ